MSTYDPKKVVFTFGGAIVSGYADGTALNFERATDIWETHTGMDDVTTFTKINNTTGSIVVSLQQGSLTNDIFSGFMLLDETLNAGLLPYLMKDLLGTTEITGTGRIMKPPAIGYANTHSPREWTIICDKMIIKVGGNL